MNGAHAHPLFQALKETPDAHGKAGRVKWNFEKFLVGKDGTVIARFKSGVTPEDLKSAIEAALAASTPPGSRQRRPTASAHLQGARSEGARWALSARRRSIWWW